MKSIALLLVACAHSAPAEVRTPAAFASVSIASDHPPVRLEEGTLEHEPVNNGGAAGVPLAERSWRPVCVEPCSTRVAAHRTYRLAGDGVVATDPFVLDERTVRLQATMGSATERTVANVFLGVGITVLLGGGVLAGAGASSGSGDFASPRDVLLLTSGVVAGTGVLLLIPAIALSLHSSSRVDVVF